MLALEEETAVQTIVGSIVWASRRLEKPMCREMSARGYPLHSVCAQLSFFPLSFRLYPQRVDLILFLHNDGEFSTASVRQLAQTQPYTKSKLYRADFPVLVFTCSTKKTFTLRASLLKLVSAYTNSYVKSCLKVQLLITSMEERT